MEHITLKFKRKLEQVLTDKLVLSKKRYRYKGMIAFPPVGSNTPRQALEIYRPAVYYEYSLSAALDHIDDEWNEIGIYLYSINHEEIFGNMVIYEYLDEEEGKIISFLSAYNELMERPEVQNIPEGDDYVFLNICFKSAGFCIDEHGHSWERGIFSFNTVWGQPSIHSRNAADFFAAIERRPWITSGDNIEEDFIKYLLNEKIKPTATKFSSQEITDLTDYVKNEIAVMRLLNFFLK